MAGVAGVPVIVARVSVEQSVPAATHALDNAGARRNGCHILSGYCRHQNLLADVASVSDMKHSPRLTQKSAVEGKRTVGEHALKRHQVEDLVDGVVCSYDANVPAMPIVKC